jgi:hypothetical protein
VPLFENVDLLKKKAWFTREFLLFTNVWLVLCNHGGVLNITLYLHAAKAWFMYVFMASTRACCESMVYVNYSKNVREHP